MIMFSNILEPSNRTVVRNFCYSTRLFLLFIFRKERQAILTGLSVRTNRVLR